MTMTVAFPAPSPVETLHPNDLMRGGDPAMLGAELLGIIDSAIREAPRSRQASIGPSEIGCPCARRIGYKLGGVEKINPGPTPWLPAIGTAVHAWLEDVFAAASIIGQTQGLPGRWLTEQRVRVGHVNGRGDIDGSCDLYDRVTATVVDWKIVGSKPLKDYRTNGPGAQYRTQAHLYGRGWKARGVPVDTVAVMFLPRTDELTKTYYWHEPYNEQIAVDALQRVDGIATAIDAVGLQALPLLPTADAYCHRCPWYRTGSTDLAGGCPGDPGRAQPGNPFTGLVT